VWKPKVEEYKIDPEVSNRSPPRRSYTKTTTESIKMGNRVSLEEQLIDLRITTKQMQRSAKKCEKNEKAAIEKLKKV
jgi:hypothetical protein